MLWLINPLNRRHSLGTEAQLEYMVTVRMAADMLFTLVNLSELFY